MSTWLINTYTPEELGLRIVGGEFRSGAASNLRLEADADFDAAGVFTFGQTVTVWRDGSVLFSGTVRKAPRAASASDERQSFVIEDAWALLEKTTYQEPWSCAGGGTVLLPMCVLGMKSNGDFMNVGEQIKEVIDFAAAAGIDIVCGTMPAGGMDLWPSEAHSLSCAEVIRNSLRYHPDWIPWIDHATSPPTFRVTARADATAAVLGVGDCSAISITKTDERVPDAVRIVYTCATVIDDVVYRDFAIDKYPLGSADSGPGVLTVDIELAGGTATIAKQQVETYDISDFTADADLMAVQDAAKAYLKWKFPKLVYKAAVGGADPQPEQGVQDSHFHVWKFGKALLADANAKPAPINPNAARLGLRTSPSRALACGAAGASTKPPGPGRLARPPPPPPRSLALHTQRTPQRASCSPPCPSPPSSRPPSPRAAWS